MLTTERQKCICAKYSAKDAEGYVHCDECPLVIHAGWIMCRANAHYDRHEWHVAGEEWSGGSENDENTGRD